MKIKRLAAFVLGMAMVVDVVPAFVFADTIDRAPNSIVVAEETEAKEEEKSESSDKKETSDSKDKKDSGSSAKEAPKSEEKKDTGSKDKKAAEPKENADKDTKDTKDKEESGSKDKGSAESGDKDASKTADKEDAGSKDKKETEAKDKENSESGDKEKAGSEDKNGVNSDDKEKTEATDKTDAGTGDKEEAGSKAIDGADSGDKEKAESGDKDEAGSKDKEEDGSEDKEKSESGDKEEPATDDKSGTDTDVKESDVSEDKEPESTAKEDEKEPEKKGKIIHGQTPIQFVKGSGSSDNDALFNNFVSAKLGVSSSAKGYRQTSIKAGDRLTGKNKIFYNVLKPNIVKVANGDYTLTIFPVTATDLGLEGASWTAKDLGLSSLLGSDGKVSKEVTLALANKLGINFKAIMEALLADCAYEQYWFNKAIGMGFALSCNVDTNESEPVLKLDKAGFVMYFTVAKKYAKQNETYETNPTEINRAKKAISNVAAIVKQAKDKADYDKLVYYRNWICANNVYNSEALSYTEKDYGDPWQIIYVFDKDPKTNVVCEGYSKAFKYLFDQTDFKENISCITVSGDMSVNNGPGGGHMWNIVKMSDGKNYLVDVTNSDNKYTGGTDRLFFVGMNKGSNSSEYYINLTASDQVRFTYDSETLNAFDAKDLVLSNTRYVAPNSLSVSGKTAKVKKKKVRKKKQTLAASKVFSFKSKGQGKLTYQKISGSKKIKINGSNGKVTVKKKTKKGTYKVTVLIKAAGSPGYRHPGSKKVTFRIKVK